MNCYFSFVFIHFFYSLYLFLYYFLVKCLFLYFISFYLVSHASCKMLTSFCVRLRFLTL